MNLKKMRGKKRYILIFTCAGVLLSGCVQTLAWSIPGVTKPYDPENYWTHNTISWPDSAPSIYTLRDIAKNGGQVIDYQNLEPNTVKDMKAVADFTKRLEELMTEITNMARIGGQTMGNFNSYLDTVRQGRTVIDKTVESAMFLADGSESKSTQVNAKSTDAKYLYLDTTYQDAFTSAKGEMRAYESRTAILKETVRRIDTAEGRVAAGQARAEIGAIAAAETKQRNQLLSQRNALDVLHGRAENDEIIRAEIIARSTKLQFANPYRPNEYDKVVYEKPAARGLPNFSK